VKGTDGKRKKIIPPHLAHSSWINYEVLAALAVLDSLTKDLKALKDKPNGKNVHKARVTLRRWFSVWGVLQDDGWETGSYKKKVRKPLKRLLTMLGGLRDCDVNLELAITVGATAEFQQECEEQGRQQKKELRDYLDKTKFKSILKQAKQHLNEQAEKVEGTSKRKRAKQSAYDHLDEHLALHEAEVKLQASKATTPEELHQLRLGIKRWRYLLTEFFGLTNLELVRAQQLLGQIHDIDRLTPALQEHENERSALTALRRRRQELLKQCQPMRSHLPYGLRPSIISSRPEPTDEQPEDIN
jgi:CHAD domain-containing protein